MIMNVVERKPLKGNWINDDAKQINENADCIHVLEQMATYNHNKNVQQWLVGVHGMRAEGGLVGL